MKVASVFLLCALATTRLYGGELQTSGFMEAEGRWFPKDAVQRVQQHHISASVVLQPEWRYRSEDQRNAYTFVPFFRWDGEDKERTHFDVREAHWLHIGDDWEILAGINKVFWGVTESRHLVDIVNQTDAVEDIDGEDKLGQLMLQVVAPRDWGTMSVFVMPGFRERSFAGPAGRLRTALPIDSNNPVYPGGADDQRVDLAIRYSHALDDWEIGLAWFHGNSREPSFRLNRTGTRLLPVYDLIHQVGADIQLTRDAWLWKFEGIVREGQGKTFWATTAGFEYTFYQVAHRATDIGLLTEYHYDGRDREAPATAFDNDLFVGSRIALNDTADSEILLGFVIDTDQKEWTFSLEAERRLTNHVKAEIRVRAFGNGEPTGLVGQLDRDDYVQVALRYFY